MVTSIYDSALQYERLTQKIYEFILQRDGLDCCEVQHNVKITGRSGVKHQIDVYWEFSVAGIVHKVLIECKNYKSNVSLEKIRNFESVLRDIPNSVGVIVTKTGFQSGVVEFAQFSGIALKILREPTDTDWQGRIRHIIVTGHMRIPINIVCDQYFQGTSEEQHARLVQAAAHAPIFDAAKNVALRFLNKQGVPNSDEMARWVPQQLDVSEYEDGGPYKKSVPLSDTYLELDLGNGRELVKVIGVVITFSVKTVKEEETSFDAANFVDIILKDFVSGDWEHVYKRQS